MNPDPPPWEAILKASRVADAARRELRADLRAKVEALRDEAMDHNWADAVVAYQTVLALIDGAGL